MDPSLLIATGASFVIGMTGYIIVRFWIRPIVRYTRAKRKLKHELNHYLAWLDEAGPIKKNTGRHSRPGLKEARKNIMALATCYGEEIPYWYRLLLDSRGESPADALAFITGMSKINDPKQIKDRISRVREKTGLQ